MSINLAAQLSKIDGSDTKTVSQLSPPSIEISTRFESSVASPYTYDSTNSTLVKGSLEISKGPKIILLSTGIPSSGQKAAAANPSPSRLQFKPSPQ